MQTFAPRLETNDWSHFSPFRALLGFIRLLQLCASWTFSIYNFSSATVQNGSNDVSHSLLPPSSAASQHYSFRQRTHSLQLSQQHTHLSDCNFIARMLHKDSYLVTLTALYWYTYVGLRSDMPTIKRMLIRSFSASVKNPTSFPLYNNFTDNQLNSE